MTKTLIVKSEVQKALLENVIFAEMKNGFWKNMRPADHYETWKDVQVTVGTEYGPFGFDVPRNYNFVNPEFFKKNEERLLKVAQESDSSFTSKKLKRSLISLNQIIGSRLKNEKSGTVKLQRGKKTPQTEIKNTEVSVTKTLANIQELEPA